MAGKKVTAARQVDMAEPGSYSAAPNLLLKVKPTGARSWVFRYQSNGKVVEIGLGKAGTKERGLAEARELAERMRAAVRNGIDPKTVLKPKHDAAALTFKHFAVAYIAHLRATPRHGKPRNEKAVDQWPSTFSKWVYEFKPVGASVGFGDKRPGEITFGDVKAVLTQRGLAALAETQKRVKQRIGVILEEAAKEEGEPHRYNPAHAFKLETRKASSVKHHASAPPEEIPAIMAELRKSDSTSARLLRWSILTACRSGEARGALWAEIDGEVWDIPGERMKAGERHRVPLCAEALEILETMREKRLRDHPRIFPGERGGLLSDVAVSKVLKRVRPGVTAHGMRASFRQWGAKQRGMSREALELALAHTNPNKVEGAYQYDDLFDLRKDIMKVWGNYCGVLPEGDNVVPMFSASA